MCAPESMNTGLLLGDKKELTRITECGLGPVGPGGGGRVDVPWLVPGNGSSENPPIALILSP